MNDLKISEACNRAADFIQVHGWGRGALTWTADNGSGVCLEGALAAVLGVSRFSGEEDAWLPFNTEELRRCPAYQAVSDHLDGEEQLWWWNDHQAQSAEHVVGVLRAVAVIHEAREREAVAA